MKADWYQYKQVTLTNFIDIVDTTTHIHLILSHGWQNENSCKLIIYRHQNLRSGLEPPMKQLGQKWKGEACIHHKMSDVQLLTKPCVFARHTQIHTSFANQTSTASEVRMPCKFLLARKYIWKFHIYWFKFGRKSHAYMSNFCNQQHSAKFICALDATISTRKRKCQSEVALCVIKTLVSR